MNRRQFTKGLGMCAAGVAAGGWARASFPSKPSTPRIAITMDDFRVFDTPRLTAEARNRAILDALASHRKLKAAMFVMGKSVDGDAKNLSLLREWDRAGHVIANHSYSHMYYNSKRVTFETFSQDALRGEEVIKSFTRFKKFFRFPYLKEGDTVEKRDRMRVFLKEHGYRNGHVTVDASDWYVDERLRKRLELQPAADLKPYRDFYLSHLWERAVYYDDLSRKVLGRSVPHTLLLHHNVANGLFLGDVLDMFARKNWKLIDAEEAFSDPVFDSAPNTLPAGESLIWALAKETGKFDKLLRYPGEDAPYEKEKMDKLGL